MPGPVADPPDVAEPPAGEVADPGDGEGVDAGDEVPDGRIRGGAEAMRKEAKDSATQSNSSTV